MKKPRILNGHQVNTGEGNLSMTADEQEPEIPDESQEEEHGNRRSKLGGAANSARNLAGAASSLSEKHDWRVVGCMIGPVQ